MTDTTSASLSQTQQTDVGFKGRNIAPETRENNIFGAMIYWHEPGAMVASCVLPRMTSTATTTSVTSGASEAAAITPQEITADGITLTVAVKANCFVLSDFIIDTSQVDWPKQVPITAARAIAAKIETDICTLFSGFSGSSGVTGTPLSAVTLDAAVTAFGIDAAEEAEKGVIALHRTSAGQLKAEAVAGSGSGAASIFVNGSRNVMDIFGGGLAPGVLSNHLGFYENVPVFQSNNVQKINTNADYAGAIFCRSPGMDDPIAAIAGYMMWEPAVGFYDQGGNNILGKSWLGRVAFVVSEFKDNLGHRLVSSV